jgi:hypothetical protein
MSDWSHPDFERLSKVLDALRHLRATSTNPEARRIAVAMLGAGEEAMRRMLAEGENTNYVPLRGIKRAAHAARKTHTPEGEGRIG